MRKFFVFGLCLILGAGAVLAAEEGAEKKAKWYDRIKFGGDFRLRYEGFSWDGYYDDGSRHRFRYRLRVGMKAQILENLEVGFQLRSGNPQNPISDNQTFDNGFDKKRISISEAYADWQATESFGFIAGKFRPKKLWVATDMEWDDDVVVEGAMQNFGWDFDGPVKTLGVNLWQFIQNESGSGAESRSFGGQVVPVFELNEKNTLAAGATYQYFQNPSEVAELYFDGDLVIDAGWVSNLVDPDTLELVSDFRVGTVLVDWKNKSLNKWPVRVTLYYFKNFGANDAEGVIYPAPLPDGDPEPLVTANAADNDTAFFARFQIGDYKRPGQVAVRLSRYDSKPDAIFFAYAQSDTRRSSNVDGYRADVRIGMPMKSFFNITYYRTDWTLGEDTTMNRWQVDYIIRF
jgi:hypothetical protein